MLPEEAARLLDENLRDFPWYISVGVGETAAGPTIFVYVKNAKKKELTKLVNGWMGFNVVVRTIGTIRAVMANTMGLL
jgi:hypothetical protein